MSDPVQEQLLGHLLGVLDDDEQAAIEASLEDDATLRRQRAVLEKRLRRIEPYRPQHDPPPGLAERTCRFVASYEKPMPGPPPRRPMTPELAPPGWISRVRWSDVAMALGVFFAAAMLAIPAIQNSRFRAHITACQDNLRVLGEALTQYSELNGGYFPFVPAEGKTNNAGIYAPMLVHGGLLPDERRLLCPGSPLVPDLEDYRVPTLEQVRLATGRELARMRQFMGGCYGYGFGYMDRGVYRGTKNLRRFHFAIMSDVPGGLPDWQSLNHGGQGQNVLLEDGHVQFVPTTHLDASLDHFFINDRGLPAPGMHLNDSVIRPSDALPMMPVDLR